MKINQTGENKGFAFLTFDSTEGLGYNFLFRNYTKISREISPISGDLYPLKVVDEICENRYHRIGPHMVEVKKAQSKQEQKSSHNDNNNGKISKVYLWSFKYFI